MISALGISDVHCYLFVHIRDFFYDVRILDFITSAGTPRVLNEKSLVFFMILQRRTPISVLFIYLFILTILQDICIFTWLPVLGFSNGLSYFT